MSLNCFNTVNYTHSNYPQSTITQTFLNQADSTLPVIINCIGAEDLSVSNSEPDQQTCAASHNIKSLKVISTNLQSVVNKVPPFLEVINKHDPDIILGSETRLTADISSSEIFPPNYNVFLKDKSNRPGGGVFIACRNIINSITCEELKYINNCEIVVCKVTLKNNKHLIICSFYRPPDNNTPYAIELCNILQDICNAYKNSLIWIAGDLNLPCIDWNFYTSGSSLSNIFLDFILEFGFAQLVDFPTRGQNTLDVFLTNYPSYEYTCQPLTGISDHEIVCLTSVVDVDYHQAIIKKVYLWHRANFDDIRPMANNGIPKQL